MTASSISNAVLAAGTQASSCKPGAAGYGVQPSLEESVDWPCDDQDPESERPRSDSDNSTGSDKVALVFEQNVKDVDLPKDNKFRTDYLRRLSAEKVWVPPQQRPPSHQSLIIFDWDDTLMYTSFLFHRTRNTVTAATKQALRRIEEKASELLYTSLSLGHTFIITNAEEGWVEECVRNYMPSLTEVIQKVRIISARTTQAHRNEPLSEWKKLAFLELGRQLDTSMITNLVAVGDAHFEMEAVHILGQQFSKSLIKTVKLQECPTPEELMKELDLVAPKFQTIVERGSNMKIHLERRAR